MEDIPLPPEKYIREVKVDDGRRRPSRKAQPSSPKDNPAPTAPSEEFAFSNAGTQYIKGLANQTGHVKGDNNATVKFPHGKDLVGELNRIKDPKNGSPTTPPNNSSTHLSGNYYSNTGFQAMTGLTNQTGRIEGSGNGCVS